MPVKRLRVLPLLLCFLFFNTVSAASELDRIYMVGASHIDLAWKWNYEDAVQVCHNTFRDVMDLMDVYERDLLPGNPMFYSQSQAQAYAWMQQRYPEIFKRILEWEERGLWEVVGGMWAESDTNLTSGESLVRQVVHGKLFFLEQMGVDVRVGWLPDTFGYSVGLPQIFKKAGIDYFACTKINWNEVHPPAKHMFNWMSPDGSSVLAYISIGHYNDIPLADSLDKLEHKLAQLHPEIPFYLFYVGIGDHGGGVFKIFMDIALHLQRTGYPIVFARSEEFFEHLASHGVVDVIPDELYVEFHRGTYTSRADVKERNRKGEIAAEILEKFAACSVPYEGVYPYEVLDLIWKKILLNQFHDVLPGTGIDLVYEDTDRDYDYVEIQTGDLTAAAQDVLASEVDTEQGPAGEPLLVFNPLSWKRSGPVVLPMAAEKAEGMGVLDAGGNPVLSQYSSLDNTLLFWAEDVPSVGYKTFYLAPADVSPLKVGSVSASSTHMENEFLTAELDPSTGLLVSLRDKRLQNREVIQPGAGANALQIYIEGGDIYPAWNLAYDKYRTEPIRLDKLLTLEQVESGPLRTVVRATYQLLGMTFEQQIVLYAGLPRLGFRFRVDDWGTAMNLLLKVAFPLNLTNQAKQATYDVPYAALTRTHDGSKANWEACGQKWVNLQDDGPGEAYGVALLSGNKYGFDLANDGSGEGLSDGGANILRMTLLKSSSQPLPGALGLTFGGPVTDKGTFESTYALYPHEGAWEGAGVVRQAYELNYPFQVHRTGRHEGELPPSLAFLQVLPETVVATVLKMPERPVKKNELVLRLFETSRRNTRVSVKFPTKEILNARETDLLERALPAGRPVTLEQRGFSLDMGHDEIVTIRLEYRETSPQVQEPIPGNDSDGGCGCSSLEPGAPYRVTIVYACVFWLLILLVPLILRSRIRQVRYKG